MKYKFDVTIFLTYLEEQFNPEIELSEDDVATIKHLLSVYEGDIEQGLMPVLEEGPEELYDKFYQAIFPRVFIAIYNDEEEADHPTYDVDDWDDDIVNLLIEKHYDDYCFDDAFICAIPEEWIPDMHL